MESPTLEPQEFSSEATPSPPADITPCDLEPRRESLLGASTSSALDSSSNVVTLSPDPVLVESVTLSPDPVLVESVTLSPDPVLVESVTLSPDPVLVESVSSVPPCTSSSSSSNSAVCSPSSSSSSSSVPLSVLSPSVSGNEEKKDTVTKRVFLIRHCESQNNVDKREVGLAFKNLKFMNKKTAGQLLTLAGVPMNSELSIPGREQCKQQALILRQADFVRKHGVQLIVHSHLVRAADTCKGLFAGYEGLTLEHKHMYEKDILEHIGRKDLSVRTEAIKRYLLNRPEDAIVLVGHSAVFRDFMQRADKVDNCDVWQVTLRATRGPQGDFHKTKDENLVEGSCQVCAKKVKRGAGSRCTVCGWKFHRKCVAEANSKDRMDSESNKNPEMRMKQLPKVCQAWEIKAFEPTEQHLLHPGGNTLLVGTPFEVKSEVKANSGSSHSSSSGQDTVARPAPDPLADAASPVAAPLALPVESASDQTT